MTRRDLSPGYQATQATHAALTFSVEHPDVTRQWHDESNYLIVLAAPDEAALASLAARAFESGIRFSIFREPDLDNEITGIVLEAGPVAQRLCSSLPLALREEALV